MKRFNLKFSLEKIQGFVLRITEHGKTNGSRVKVKNLKNPDFTQWNTKEQRFMGESEDVAYNNYMLAQIKAQYQHVIDTMNPYTASDVKDMACMEVEENNDEVDITMKDFLQKIITEMKGESNIMPSKNYQNYITLLHKLEEAYACPVPNRLHIVNMPVKDVTDAQFKQFGRYIVNVLKGKNYTNLMKVFKSTISRAKRDGFTDTILKYSYSKDTPRDLDKAIKQIMTGVDVLTKQQYKRFISFDLELLEHGNNLQVKLMELYRDFCVFMYETKMRPVDVLKLKATDIKKGKYIIYSVTKKKNCSKIKNCLVNTPATPEALRIIDKYKGISPQGYIFPFKMNERVWNLKDPVSFNKWYNKKQATLERINIFLRTKIAPELNATQLSLYTFRHTAFTHRIKEGVNIFQLAKEGGTSVAMLEKHYYNHLI